MRNLKDHQLIPRVRHHEPLRQSDQRKPAPHDEDRHQVARNERQFHRARRVVDGDDEPEEQLGAGRIRSTRARARHPTSLVGVKGRHSGIRRNAVIGVEAVHLNAAVPQVANHVAVEIDSRCDQRRAKGQREENRGDHDLRRDGRFVPEPDEHRDVCRSGGGGAHEKDSRAQRRLADRKGRRRREKQRARHRHPCRQSFHQMKRFEL